MDPQFGLAIVGIHRIKHYPSIRSIRADLYGLAPWATQFPVDGSELGENSPKTLHVIIQLVTHLQSLVTKIDPPTSPTNPTNMACKEAEPHREGWISQGHGLGQHGDTKHEIRELCEQLGISAGSERRWSVF